MKLSEIKQVLAAGDIQLTKSLGQNFLHDGNQLRRLAGAAQLTKHDKVLEIGPGLGPLTASLLEQAGEVLAIEKDQRLFDWLRQRFASAKNLTLLHADALDYLRDKPRDWSAWKLAANLPYSVASPILAELALAQGPPERMVTTLQIEVARRLVARPGSRDYGVLTLLVQAAFEPEGWFKISSSCFFPEPDVDSACLMLQRRREPLLAPELRESFAALVKRSFSQRRKMMLKLLKTDWPADAVAAGFDELGLDRQVRAEAVSLEQFVRLTQWLCTRVQRG